MKYVFGIKDVIVSILSVVIFWLIAVFQSELANMGAVVFSNGIYLPVMFLVVVAIIYGKAPGIIASSSGMIVTDIFFRGSINFVDLVITVLFTVSIAMYAEASHFMKNSINIVEGVNFNIFQTMAGVVCWVLLGPLLNYFFKIEDFGESMIHGINRAVGNSIGIFVIDTAIFCLISVIKHKKLQK